MKTKNFEQDKIIEFIDENNWIKYCFYAGGAVIGIWLLGKASKLLSDAVVNFKSLHNAIKH